MSALSLPAASRQNAGQELRRIVRINEEIKKVVTTAFKINLMAMNAIFLAKRAGQSALGFGVLSNELRRFAMDLQRQMETLRIATTDSVVVVTGLVKQTRVERIFQRTLAVSKGQGRRMVEACLRARNDRYSGDESGGVTALNRRLSQMISDTAQLVELGSVLARSAKIEAAYGGTFSTSLMQVSSDFEQTISDIQKSLDTLTKHQSQEFAG
ncbi:MAG: chemotaxis protein [Rhodocyclaceae bacterium]|nr:MAG: chemotaxis protein [Rhodocyclaceae bacterium]